jgi:hypothetical protein
MGTDVILTTVLRGKVIHADCHCSAAVGRGGRGGHNHQEHAERRGDHAGDEPDEPACASGHAFASVTETLADPAHP